MTHSGQISDGNHVFQIRVYYEDTDFSGVVYHANYLKYCERARSDYLRVVGVDQSAMGAEAIFFVVRKMDCDFLKPARFDELLTVLTRGTGSSGARFQLSQKITRGDDVVFAADVTVALIDAKGKPQRISAILAEKLQVASKPFS